jgi:hypothetical protein
MIAGTSVWLVKIQVLYRLSKYQHRPPTLLKSLFDEECPKFLDQGKQAKLQWLHDLSQI